VQAVNCPHRTLKCVPFFEFHSDPDAHLSKTSNPRLTHTTSVKGTRYRGKIDFARCLSTERKKKERKADSRLKHTRLFTYLQTANPT